jgi:hypothetical protein
MIIERIQTEMGIIDYITINMNCGYTFVCVSPTCFSFYNFPSGWDFITGITK